MRMKFIKDLKMSSKQIQRIRSAILNQREGKFTKEESFDLIIDIIKGNKKEKGGKNDKSKIR